MSRTFTMLMPEDLRERIERYAEKNDRQLSDTIRVAVREFLDKHESQANDDREGRAGKDTAKDSDALHPGD